MWALVLLLAADRPAGSGVISTSTPAAFRPLWNSAFNATAIGGKAQSRPPCPGPELGLALSGFLIGNNVPHDGNGGYNGAAVATLHYDFGMSGLVPFYAAGVAINGGLPQSMNMSKHIAQLQLDIERQLKFGVGVGPAVP